MAQVFLRNFVLIIISIFQCKDTAPYFFDPDLHPPSTRLIVQIIHPLKRQFRMTGQRPRF